jgi:hypothetical protein
VKGAIQRHKCHTQKIPDNFASKSSLVCTLTLLLTFRCVMPRQVPRARATPRQIRDIKPKRQLPRAQASDHDESWWQEANNETNNATDALTQENTNGASPHPTDASPDDAASHAKGKLERVQLTCSDWYHHTTWMKKLKQLFWTVILCRTLRLIYVMDLDDPKWQADKIAYDSLYVKDGGVGKSSSVGVSKNSYSLGYDSQSYAKDGGVGKSSFFSKEDLTEASLYSPKSSLYNEADYGSGSSYLRGSGVGKITEPDYIHSGSLYPKSNIKSMLGYDDSNSWKSGPLSGAKRVVKSILGSSDKKPLQQQDFGDVYSLGGGSKSLAGYPY